MIRWGVVGAGMVARRFVMDLAHCTNGTIQAIASPGGTSARTLANTCGAKAYSGLNELLRDPHVDAIYIATPNELHASHCKSVINTGKAVLCEKPFAMTQDEANSVVELARHKGVFCMEAMWTRFLPLIDEVTRLVRAGAIGQVLTIRAELGFPVSYTSQLRQGGGALLDLGVYGVSFAHSLLGPPSSVAASARFEAGVDAHCSALLSYPQAQVIVVSSHVCELGNSLSISGEQGRIEVSAPFLCGFEANYFSTVRRPPGELRADGAALHWIRSRGLWTVARRVSRTVFRNGKSIPGGRYNGHGYQFQAQAVGRAIASGQLECDVMPLNDTLAVMGSLDAIRAQF